MPSSPAIAAVVLTRNEEAALPRCLDALAFCAEVFVVDSNSTDATARVARERGATVIPFDWDGRYPKKKQWSLENVPTTTNHLLLLDADEVVTPELADEIQRLLADASPDLAAADVTLGYHFSGRRLAHGHRVVKRVLVDRRRVAFPVIDDLDATNMWEVEGHYQPDARGSVARLSATLLHDDPGTPFDYFGRHNRYSDWEAHLRLNAEQRARVNGSRSRAGAVFARLPCQPALFFFYSYVVRQGFRDGRAGLDYAIAQMAYYWQIGFKTRMLQSARATASGPAR